MTPEGQQPHTSCAECEYRRNPVPLPVIRAGGRASAGVIEALMSHEANKQSSKAFERERVMAGESFVRPPHHFEWCARYTLTADQCNQITEALKRGDAGPADEARTAGFEMEVDYVNGRVIRLYALCLVKNTGQCAGFREPDSGGPS